jgi:hypothetical protein
MAVFGVAYACLQLGLAGNALGVPAHPRLGDAALIATSMGIAGGLIDGNLALGPKIVAHIQLLLFLSALTGAIVAALRSWRRSEAPVPEPEEPQG